MSDDNPLFPFAYEGLDPAPEPKSTIADVSDAVKGTVKSSERRDKSGSKARYAR